MRRPGLIGSVVVAALVLAGPGAGAQKGGATSAPLQTRNANAEFVVGELIVQFRPGTSSAARRDALGSARVADSLGAPGLTLVRLAKGASVRASAAELARDPRVVFAEPNYVRRPAQIPPNDPFYSQLWGLSQASDFDIDAPEAWATTTGSDQVIVAVIDSGVAYDHPDLAANMWSHPVTGAPGRDFLQEDDMPLDHLGHGTHVAGTIGAVGHNMVGITGVNQDVTLMALRVGHDEFEDADILQAINYACANGADVVNGSFGGPGKAQALANAIKSVPCRSTIFVFAAGNDGVILTNNTRATNAYPCEYHRAPPHGFSAANVLCVGASTRGDLLSGFSNRGPKSVHLAAPGGSNSPAASQQILSTWPGYQTVWGPDDMETPGTWGDPINVGPNGHLAQNWAQRAGPATSGSFALSDSVGNYRRVSFLSTIRNMTPIDLSGEFGCLVEHQVRLHTEPGFDWFGVFAGFDQLANDAEIGAWSGTTNQLFVPLTSDLTAVDGGNPVYLRFFLESDASIANFDGAYVDDVLVKCIQPGGAGYEAIQGTSMASPHVAGVAALLLAAKPDLTVAKLKNAILKGVDKKAAFTNRVSTGGRLNADKSIDVALDMTPPNTTINGRPPASTTSRRATFRFASSEAGSTFQCRHMNGSWLSCTSPKLYTGLTLGLHTFRVRAIDKALNVDPTPAMDTWRIRR